VLHATALPGNPCDGHTLRAAIEGTEKLIGREIERAYVDKGYRGHNAPNPVRDRASGAPSIGEHRKARCPQIVICYSLVLRTSDFGLRSRP
jgi:hypothetical protein